MSGSSRAALCLGLLGAALGGAAQAQTQPAGSGPAAPTAANASTTLGEIVVTARRTAENAQKIPVAVTAHTGAQIDQLVVNSVQDINKLAPGLQVTATNGTRNNNEPSIRGQGTSFGTGQSSVISYFAEVPHFQTSVMDLANLQVIKGPQGTLFGGTATGGVVLFEPKRPTENEVNGYITGEFGNYAYKEVEGALGAALIPDELMVRGAFKIRRRDGYTHAIQSWGGSTDVDNIDTNEWRLSAIFRPVSNFENYFVYAGSYDTSHGESSPLAYVDNRFMAPSVRNIPLSFVPLFATGYLFETGVSPPPGASFAQLQTAEWAKQIAAGPRTTFYNYSHENAHEFNGVVNQTRWDILSNLTVRNIFGYTWRRQRGPSIDIDGGDLPLVDTRSIVKPDTTNLYDPDYAWVGGNVVTPAQEMTEELQFQGKLFDNRLVWQAGGFYDKAQNPDFTPNSAIWVFTLLASAPDPVNGPLNGGTCVPVIGTGPTQCLSTLVKNEQTDKAIYTQGTFAITDWLHFTAGVRHSWASRDVTTALTNSDFFIFNGLPFALPISGRTPIAGSATTQTVPTEEKTTYNFAVDWQVTDDILVYGTTRTGYKPGGINQNAPVGNPNRTFGPETLKDWEFGFKTQWSFAGVLGRTNLALFHDSYDSIQTSNVIPGTATTITINSAQAVIQGAELDTAMRFSDWFDFNGWYAYLDAHYTNFVQTFACSPGSEYWYTECATATVPRQLLLDHAHGIVTIQNLTAGGPVTISTYHGLKDTFFNSAKHTFSLQPTVHFAPWIHENVSLTSNFQFSSSMRMPNSTFPGVTLAPAPAGSGVSGKGPFYMPSHLTIDLRLDWKNVMGTKLNASAVATNVTNRIYNLAPGGGFTISGGLEYIYSEPRMFYIELNYPFGGGS